jgi:hypothetical protein
MGRGCPVDRSDLTTETMSYPKLIRYAIIPLVAILAFWWAGYSYFRGSADWQEVQSLITASPVVQSRVGEVTEISLGPFPFAYRFSGDYAKVTLRVTVKGTDGEYRATISAERRGGTWALVS